MMARKTSPIPVVTLAALLEPLGMANAKDDDEPFGLQELPTQEMHPLELERLLAQERTTAKRSSLLLGTPKRGPRAPREPEPDDLAAHIAEGSGPKSGLLMPGLGCDDGEDEDILATRAPEGIPEAAGDDVHRDVDHDIHRDDHAAAPAELAADHPDVDDDTGLAERAVAGEIVSPPSTTSGTNDELRAIPTVIADHDAGWGEIAFHAPVRAGTIELDASDLVIAETELDTSGDFEADLQAFMRPKLHGGYGFLCLCCAGSVALGALFAALFL